MGNTFMTPDEIDKHNKIKAFSPDELAAYKEYKYAAYYNAVAQYVNKSLTQVIDLHGYTCEFLIVSRSTEDQVVYVDSVGLIHIVRVHVNDLIRVIHKEVNARNKSCFIHTRDRGSCSYYIVVTIN